MRKNWFAISIILVVSLWGSLVFADETLPSVIFDEGHGQRFLIGEKGELQLSVLADIIRGKGAQVAATVAPLSDDTLKGAAALVISGPFESLRPDEVQAVARFVEKGGRLAMMLHIGPPLAGLLDRLDIDHSNAVLHERNNLIDKDINFIVKELNPVPLFAGIARFSVYGGWALRGGRDGAGIARTSEQAWVDLNGDKLLSEGDAVGAFDVVVGDSFGAGSYLVFGDDAIFQNRYLDVDNRKLAENLAGWLKGP